MAITDRRIGTQIYGGKAPTKYTVAKGGLTEAQKATRAKRTASLAAKRAAEEAARLENLRRQQLENLRVVAEVGDTPSSLAQKAGIEEIDFIQANQGVTTIKADAVYNIPDISKRQYDLEELYGQPPTLETRPIPSPPPAFLDPVFETAPMSPEGIVYPDAMNPELFAQYGQTMGTEEFDYEGLGIGKYYQQGYFEDVEDVEDLYGAVEGFRESYGAFDARRFRTGQYGEKFGLGDKSAVEIQALQKELDRGKYYQEGMFEMPGMPVKYRWEQDEQGNWVDRGPEAIFDALYEMNGIDPNDDAMIEWFWGFADDDLLFMGEFFDVIEWPTGGGGGYGGYGTTPTPSQQYGGRGGRGDSARGDYASYLSLTSWSI